MADTLPDLQLKVLACADGRDLVAVRDVAHDLKIGHTSAFIALESLTHRGLLLADDAAVIRARAYRITDEGRKVLAAGWEA